MGATIKLTFLISGAIIFASWLFTGCTPGNAAGRTTATTSLPDGTKMPDGVSAPPTVAARPPATIPATFTPNRNALSSETETSKGGLLFAASDRSGSLDTSGDPAVVRSRFVDIKLALLEGAEAGDTVVLNLFEDAVFTAVLDSRGLTSNGFAWTGHIAGTEHGMVTLITGGGQMAANITLDGAHYQVRYAGDGVHAIYEIRQSAFPGGDEPIIPDG